MVPVALFSPTKIPILSSPITELAAKVLLMLPALSRQLKNQFCCYLEHEAIT